MKKIPLTQGYEALVDDEDYEKVSKLKWQATGIKVGRIYARHAYRDHKKKVRHFTMHSLIMGTVGVRGAIVDHISGDSSDNQKVNLRIVTHAQNMANRKKHRNGKSSRFSGVHYYPSGSKGMPWKAMICDGVGGRHYVGVFSSELAAAAAWNASAYRLRGKFARLNILK